jgi:hypothetical protein
VTEFLVEGFFILKINSVAGQLVPENVTLGRFGSFKKTLHEGFIFFELFAQLLLMHLQIHTFTIEIKSFFLFE